ncbi:hypothetical protein [Streptomyces sp. 049-1]|uniref:hypothetical protein n=1 Tax=Streptomyces sp. 049-1 TaxID=2789264 RepID=UPI00397F3022
MTDGGVNEVNDFANMLIRQMRKLIAPDTTWAPKSPSDSLFEPFLWLGQHLAIAIFTCVVVICAMTAWQGLPRLRQMGASTGWTLVAIVGMSSVPGAVQLLNEAVAAGFRTMFASDDGTLFGAIQTDMDQAADAGNPLAHLLILSALCVSLLPALLVFLTRNIGILVFVCASPLYIASVARGGDMTGVKVWVSRLGGLIFAPFALVLVAPLVPLVRGSLVMDMFLLLLADALMIRWIFTGIPWFGPRLAGAARSFVEQRTDVPVLRAAARFAAPDYYEEESVRRQPRTVPTPGRAITQDASALLGAYGVRHRVRAGQLTIPSAIDKAERDAPRQARLMQARRQARDANTPSTPERRTGGASARPTSAPGAAPATASRPAPRPPSAAPPTPPTTP